ncbi:MAG: serine/threonine protein kinase/WD40 repeat protein [Planctomycetota bacterium]
MSSEPDFDDAVLYDFLLLLQSDDEQGRLRSPADYVAFYPAHESAVRREYASFVNPEMDEFEGGSAQRIGPYNLLDELGRGGQGTVYLAEDTHLGRRVALKVLSTALGAIPMDRLARFEREAKVVARLDHPGICPIFEAVLDADMAYIAMRYVSGETLAQRITAARNRVALGANREVQEAQATSALAQLHCRPSSSDELATLWTYFERAARALQAAHDEGVVHRDIKPGNLMVTDGAQPVLLDFGIAHAHGAGLETLTRSGDVFGTLLYMPPEQLRGDMSRNVDHRADIYALGASMFEALTLRPPFRGGDQLALTEAIMHAPVPEVCNAQPELPAAVQGVLETALDKEPRRRYRSATEFADDIARLREDQTVVGKRVGAWLRVRRFAWRRPALTASVIALVIATALSTAWWSESSSLDEVRNQRAEAELIELVQGMWKEQQIERRDPAAGLIYAEYWSKLEQTPDSRAAYLESLEGIWERRRIRVSRDRNSRIQAVGPDRMLCGDEGGHLRLFDMETGLRLDAQDDNVDGQESDCIDRIVVDDSRKHVLTVSKGGQLREWSLEDLSDNQELTSTGPGFIDAAFRPNSTEFIALRSDGSLVSGAAGGASTMQIMDSIQSYVWHAKYGATGDRLLLVESSRDEAAPKLARLVIRSTRDGSRLVTCDGAVAHPLTFAVDASQKLAAIGDKNGRILLVTLAEPNRKATYLSMATEPAHMEFDPKSQWLVVSHLIDNFGHTGTVWDTASRQVLFQVQARVGGLSREAHFSPSSSRLALLSSDHTLRLFDCPSGTFVRDYSLRNGSVTMQWGIDDQSLFAASVSYLHKFYALERSFLPRIDRAHESAIQNLEVLAEGSRLLSRAEDGSLALWSLPALDRIQIFEVEQGKTVVGAGALAGCLFVWMATADGVLHCWRKEALEWSESAQPLASAFRLAHNSPQGERALLVPFSGAALLIDESTADARRIGSSTASYVAACFDGSGKLVALSDGSKIEVWDVSRAERLAEWELPISHGAGMELIELCFRGQGAQTLLARSKSAITPWNWRKAKAGAGVGLEVDSRVYFDPDGSQSWVAIVASDSADAEVWSPGDGAHAIRGGQSAITSVLFPDPAASAAGGMSAIGYRDGSVRLLESVRGELHMTIPYHDSAVTAIAYEARGQWLISGTEQGELRAWPLDLPRAAREAHSATTAIDHYWEETRERMLSMILRNMED